MALLLYIRYTFHHKPCKSLLNIHLIIFKLLYSFLCVFQVILLLGSQFSPQFTQMGLQDIPNLEVLSNFKNLPSFLVSSISFSPDFMLVMLLHFWAKENLKTTT